MRYEQLSELQKLSVLYSHWLIRMPVTDFYDNNSGKKEKSMISELEQDSKKRITELEESLKKKKQVNFFDAPLLCQTHMYPQNNH